MADVTIAKMGWGCRKCLDPVQSDYFKKSKNDFLSSVAYIEVPGFENDDRGLPTYE